MRRASKRTSNEDGFNPATARNTESTHCQNRKHTFDLAEAPTFYPTSDEFADPLKYIDKIRVEAEKYGIAKIVPPKEYKPEFCIKTKDFRFKTRIQKLNNMEGESRSIVNYLEQLYKYHQSISKQPIKIPQLDKRPIDLFRLKMEVSERGGVQLVTKQKKWAEIGRIMGYARKQCTSMSNALKSAYQKIVLPYEIWHSKHAQDVEDADATAESEKCEVCHSNENEDALLLCDGCNRGYHLYCLTPALKNVPKSDWFCSECLTAVKKEENDYQGGTEYSLSAFQKKCDQFKSNWFPDTPTEEECENEFWRLADNPKVNCQVEFGADLHSALYGSGFTVAEQLPKDNTDPWNLNIIPITPNSLFTHVKTPASTMTAPWVNIGMCFSAHSWHSENHFAYSMSYLHWGETKTYYAIPSTDAPKFEDAMKKSVPELFEQQPDLLSQLVTFISPGRLQDENVQVYTVDQRPGEFVVTFPKVYHSGFNHGFNFCETVNFLPSQWIDYGYECIKRYKQHRHQPCFSHDELIVTALHDTASHSQQQLAWLKKAIVEMQARELNERKALRKQSIKEQHIPETNNDQEQRCVFCNCYTYLSHVSCTCTEKISCLDHVLELCTCPKESRTLCLRFSDGQLSQLVREAQTMTSTDSADFREKVVALWSRETTPTLQELRTLLAEGEQEKDPENEQELKYMRTYIQQLAQWTQEAKLFLQRPVSQGNSLQKPVDKLLVRACEVGADKDNNPLFVELSKYKDQIQSFDDKVKEALASSNLAHQKKIYQLGRELKSGSEDFQLLAEMVMGREWELQVEETLKKPFNVRHIRRLIKRGKELGLNGVLPDHLAQIEQSGKKWTSRIDHICKGKLKVNLSDEHELLTAGKNNENPNLNITIDPDVMAKLEELIRKSKETLKEMDDIFECKRPSLLDRPSITDAQRLLTAGKDCIFESDQVKVLQHEVSRVSFWHDQARSLFVCGKLPLDTIAKETLANVQSITLNQDKVELWCLCRRPEAGLMVECDVCHEWYHNSCIKMPAHVEEESSSVAYICPVCSGENDKVQHFTNKPKLEDMMDVLEKAETLLFCPKEFGTLDAIQQIMLDYKNKVQAFCRSRTQLTVQDVPMIRKHLRHLEGLEIALPDETDFLKDKLASLAPLPSFAQVGHHKSVESRLDHVPSLAPLVFHNENSSSMCTCGRLALENANAIECLECHHKFHIGCIGPLQNDAYHCPRCTRDIVPSRLSGNKRSSEEPTIKPLKKVIKLTVNPPQPVPTLKRKTTIEDKSSKKQKLTEDSFQRSERV